MSVLTISDLRERSIVDPLTHCWIWQRGVNSSGAPCVRTIDFERCDKIVMSGPRAAFQIAHQRAPLPGWLIMRSCGSLLCMNPAHLREVRNRRSVFEQIKLSGRWLGKNSPAKMEALAKARAALGQKLTPPDVVRAIRSSSESVSNLSLAKTHSLSRKTIAEIRGWRTHKGVSA